MTDIAVDPLRWESLEAGDSALLHRWLVSESDHVRAGQPLAEVLLVGETIPVIAPHAGVLEEILMPAGQRFAPRHILGRLVTF